MFILLFKCYTFHWYNYYKKSSVPLSPLRTGVGRSLCIICCISTVLGISELFCSVSHHGYESLVDQFVNCFAVEKPTYIVDLACTKYSACICWAELNVFCILPHVCEMHKYPCHIKQYTKLILPGEYEGCYQKSWHSYNGTLIFLLNFKQEGFHCLQDHHDPSHKP